MSITKTITKTKKSTKSTSQIRINRTAVIDEYLSLAKIKYKILDDNEIIKVWLSKGIEEEFGESDSLFMAKQALAIYLKDEDDQDTNLNYNPQNTKQITW